MPPSTTIRPRRFRRGRWTVLVIAAVLILAATMLTSVTAQAQDVPCDVTTTDPADNGFSNRDILETCAAVDGDVLSLGIRTVDRDERGWSTYVNADGREYDVTVEPDGASFRSVVTDRNTGGLTCSAEASFGGDAWRYAEGLTATECFGGADTTPLSVVWVSGSDVAPDAGATLVAEGDGDADGDPVADGPLSGGCDTQVIDPADNGFQDRDIVEACAEYDGVTLDLSIRTISYARSAWSVVLQVDGQPYTAEVQTDAGEAARALVTDANNDVVCEASVAWGPSDQFRHIRNIDVEACFGSANLPISARWLSGSDTAPDGEADTVIAGDDGSGGSGEDPGGENGNPTPSGDIPAAPPGLRLAGASRFETSANVALYAWPDGAAEVYLARADNPADALSGGSLPHGPVLLVPTCDGLPEPIATAITTLAPERVIALGGDAAVCQATLDAANGL